MAQVPQRPRESTRANPAGLTNRQLDVAKLVARGYTNAEIAAELFISVGTVKTHLGSVHTKLNARNRVEVAAWAWERKLLN